MANKPLSDRERAFCRHYVILHNAKEAAIKAGYAKGSAHVSGHRLLQRPAVRAEIERLEAEALRRANQITNLISDANRVSDPTEPVEPGSTGAQVRAEMDAGAVAAATRAYLLAAAIENLEITLGRRKRRIVRFKKIKGKNGEPDREEVLEIQIFDPNPTAANQAITILLKEIGGQTPDSPEQAANPDVSPALLDALATFRTSRPEDPAK